MSVDITSLNGADVASSSDTIGPMAIQSLASGALGPFALGMLLDIYLGGFALYFFLRYIHSSSYRADRPRLRLLVVVAQGLSMLDMASNWYSTYHYMTSQHRDTNTLYSQTIVDALSLIPPTLLGVIVQMYLAKRASSLFTSRIAKSLYLTVITLGIATTAMATILYTTLSMLSRAHGTESIGPFDFNKSMGTYLWGSAFVDILVSVGLCVQYRARMIEEQQSRTNSVMRRLIKLAIESAFYTSTFALIGAILDFAFKEGDLRRNSTLAFQIPLASLYYISLLVNLNSRAKIREIFQTTPSISMPIRTSGGGNGGQSFIFTAPVLTHSKVSSDRPPYQGEDSFGDKDSPRHEEFPSAIRDRVGSHRKGDIIVGLQKAESSSGDSDHHLRTV